jgi:polyisoprenoid-binding protein YceI
MTRRTLELTWFLIVAAGASLAIADPRAFDFKDPKGVNTIVLSLDSLVEPMSGYATNVSGTVRFDPANPEATTGKLIIPAGAVTMANPMMTQQLHTKAWLDVEKFPTIEFGIKKVLSAEKKDNVFTLKAVGDFTLKGVTRELTVDVSLTCLDGKAETRNHNGKGDLLVVRAQFDVDRRQFDLKPDMGPELVANDIHVRVAIVGLAPAP